MPENGSALTPLPQASNRRLDSWKGIAAYLGRGVRSVQRWEREEGLPVHRLSHQKRGSVYAYKDELDRWWEGHHSSLVASEPEQPPTAQQQEYETRSSRRLSRKSVVLAGAAIIAGAVLYVAIRHGTKSGPEMRQLTHIGGVRPLGCSLSSDGKIVAFASDAAEEGNIDIWIQETGRSEARRLTHGPEADIDPSISPDGAKVLFVSRRASGSGIYEIAASGGQERLLIPEGEQPRYSPDGKRIAYLKGNQPRLLYVSDSGGENVRELPTHLAQFDHPIWSPDGKDLMLSGQRSPADPADWWIIPVDGEQPKDTQLLHNLSPYISSSLRLFFYAQAWLPGERLLFAGDQDGMWSIWQIRLSPGSFRLAGAPERITGRTPIAVPFAVGGNRLAIVNALPDSQLWRLPVDTGRGQMLGTPRRITREGISQFPSLSGDGRVLAFNYSRTGAAAYATESIYVRHMETGEETVVSSGTERKGYTTLSRDGSKIVYGTIVPGVKRPIYLYDLNTRTTRKLCDDCEGRPYDWSPDGTKLILSMPGKGIGLMDVSTGERSVILQGTSAVFSPDGRWLAVALGTERQGGRIAIVPFRGREKVLQHEWMPVGEPGFEGLFPAWSPSGELVFFIATSHSDPSNYVLTAQRFHPESGKLEGPPFDVYRFDEPSLPLLKLPLNNRLAMSPGQIILASAASKGDIWLIEGRK